MEKEEKMSNSTNFVNPIENKKELEKEFVSDKHDFTNLFLIIGIIIFACLLGWIIFSYYSGKTGAGKSPEIINHVIQNNSQIENPKPVPENPINNSANNKTNKTIPKISGGGSSSGGSNGGGTTPSPTPDTVYPQFSNFSDNNGTLVNSGIAEFNVSVANSNGTVVLNLNGTSYSATDLGGNIFQVSLTLTYGNYSYYWYSYGSGSNHNYNSSSTKNYVVNYDPNIPLFSNYWDNSHTFNDSGTGKFNVSVVNTNGSVYLHINGNDYKATNRTANIYNVSVSFFSAGNYNYYWYSYGNGTYHIYNSSSIRTFVVNGTTIHISSCGYYEYPNAYLILDNNISSNMSCLFLAGNITLDLNGYTIKFLDAPYNHVPNYNFENWAWNGSKYLPDNWNTSLAPNAIRRNTSTDMPLIGNYLIYVPVNETIVSDWVYLTVENRTYRGLIVERGTGDWGQISRIEVLNSSNNVVCTRDYSGRMGGGTGFCNFKIQTPGNYRLRITPTQRASYYDYGDIQPTHDFGIGVIRYYYDVWCVDDSGWCKAPDYIDKYPSVSISTNITVINGSIEAGSEGLRTYGIYMYDDMGDYGIGFNMDNVNIKTSGIGTHTLLDGLPGTIKNSKFYNHMPWVMDREDIGEASINLGDGIIFDNNTVIGGQGLIYPTGNDLIRNNYLRNNETVTNHYSIMGYGTINVSVYNNIIEPEKGSGILISSECKNWTVYNNFFNISAATCDPEYLSGQEFTTNAIRITDYDSSPGSSHSTSGNLIYNNTFYIYGKYYPNYPDCQTIANGIFYSVGGGDNYIENNSFFVTNTNKSSMAYAIYIGGSHNGGVWRNNHVKANDAGVWVTSYYGPSANSRFENNTFERNNDGLISGVRTVPLWDLSCSDYANFRFGACCGWEANNITLINNNYINTNISQDCYYANDYGPYDFYYKWYLNLFVNLTNGSNADNAKIILKSNLSEKTIDYTDSIGFVRMNVLDFNQSGDIGYTKYYTYHNPYNITIWKYGYKANFSFLNINQTTNIFITLLYETSECLVNDSDHDGYGLNCSLGSYDCNESDVNTNPGADETCNGIDNNCNGEIDEGFGNTTCGLGVCNHTIANCQDGQLQTCDPYEGQQSETCGNGIDEDCDGYDSLCINTTSINILTPDLQTFNLGLVNLSCEANDSRGLKYLDLFTNISGSFSLTNRSYANLDNIWIEAEDFNFDSDYWQICGENDSCESNYFDSAGDASGMKHVVTKELYFGNYPMNITKYFGAGNYYLWARGFKREDGNVRIWNVSLDGHVFNKSFGNSGTNYNFIWESGGNYTIQTPGNYTVNIIDASPDYYWAYPDLLLFTRNSTYNPSTYCGNNVSVFKSRMPYTEIYEGYNNFNCNLTINYSRANFNITISNSGNYNWACKSTNEFNWILFSQNRTFIVN